MGRSTGRADAAPLFYDLLETSLGWVGVLASPRGIRRTTLPQSTAWKAAELLGPEAHGAVHRPGAFSDLHRRLQAHFNGEQVTFDDPLDLDGASPFFREAWEACRSIPRGESRSYAWLAAQAGSPGAARAAGQAMARNRVPILIPCHRVIGSDGGLHGFGGGLDLKQRLLELEAG